MTGWIRRWPIACWYALTMLLSIFFFLVFPTLAGMRPNDVPGVGLADIGEVPLPIAIWLIVTRRPFLFTAILFAFSGTISALIILPQWRGATGLREYASHLRPWGAGVTRAEALPYYAAIVASFLALSIAMVLVDRALGATRNNASAVIANVRALGLDKIGYSATGPLAAGYGGLVFNVLCGMFLNPGALLEEMGWRGFALPNLLRVTSPLKASVIVGLFWFFWHALVPLSPLLIDWQTATAREFLQLFAVYNAFSIVTNIPGAIFITYFFNRTGGSVIATIMIHGCMNNSPFGLVVHDARVRMFSHSIFIVMGALVVLLAAGPKLGLRSPEVRFSTQPT